VICEENRLDLNMIAGNLWRESVWPEHE